ncbi:MAG: nuclear transport factor 2 family protein, partial [Gemmatimonadota bacterium]
MRVRIRNYMWRTAAIAAPVLASACARVGSATAAAPGGVQSLIAAERAFARHSERAGIKESFVANLGVDGILFRPGPVNGLEWFRTRPGGAGYLSWEPEVALMASSGDMGYTTGPWELRARGATDTVSGAGHYVTVWKRDSTGTWKMAADIGTSHRWVERPAHAAGTVVRGVVSLGDSAQKLLFARDSALGKDGLRQAEALLPALATDVRLHREGALPTLGADAARDALRGDDRTFYSTPLGGAVSRAGDFGYTYGSYELVA